MVRFIKEYFGERLVVGAEVGVFRGENACEILRQMPNVVKLYLVDPYESYKGYSPRRIKEIMEGPSKAKKQLKRAGINPQRYKWIIDHFSAPLIPEPLDFIYIDGNHSYKSVRFDIQEAKKTMVVGGVIGGHDYRRNSGVAKAVNEAYGEVFSDSADWWVIHQSA